MAVLRWVFLLCFLFCLAWTKDAKSADHGSDIEFLNDSISAASSAASNQLNICSFNIQVFGKSKMKKPQVVQSLREILVLYDVILIQEIRDSSGQAIKELLNEVNQASGNAYDLEISDRLGRSDSKEQYAYFFRPNKVQITAVYQYPDTGTFERPPFVVRVKAPGTQVKEFGYIGIHVKPSDAVNEIDALVDVYDHMVQRWNMKDFILAGDFNAGCSYVTDSDWPRIRLRQQNRFQWLIDDNTRTNLARTGCPYDRFVIAGSGIQRAVSGRASVYRFDRIQRLSPDQALAVSDHYPIEFSVK